MNEIRDSSRRANIELLRIVSMLMILMLHYFNQGEVLKQCVGGSNYYLVWILEGICYVSVNCYILISGFFSWKSSFKWKRVVALYIELLFYTLLLSAVSFGFCIEPFNLKNIISMLPIVSRKNWFVTVYFASLFITPFLNKAIINIERNSFRSLLICLILLFSVIPTIFCYIDQFNLVSGYSVLWYIVVYLIGAYIGKFEIKLKKRYCLVMFLSVSILPVSKFVIELFSKKLSVLSDYSTILYSYNSIPVLFGSIGLFLLFKELKIEGKCSKVINIFGKTTFGVFYIHSFFLLRNHIWVFLGSLRFIDSPVFLPYTILVLVICFFVFSVLEWARIYLFKVLKINNLIDKITIFLVKRIWI